MAIPAGCCVNAKAALECGTCVANKGNQTLEDFQACLKAGGISHTNTIIIAVCSVVGGLIFIAVVVVAVRLRKSARAREKLLGNLRRQGVDERLVQQVGDLNYANMSSSEFHKVDRDLAMKRAMSKASKKLQKVSKPKNVQLNQAASEMDGLFSL